MTNEKKESNPEQPNLVERNAFERVENFIQRLQDNDWRILPEARKIKYSTPAYGKRSLADYLSIGQAMYHHEQSYMSALTFDNYISDAFNHAVIAEGEGLVTKNKKLNERISQLENEKNALQRRLDKILKRNEQLEHEWYIFKGTRFTGDVEQDESNR